MESDWRYFQYDPYPTHTGLPLDCSMAKLSRSQRESDSRVFMEDCASGLTRRKSQVDYLLSCSDVEGKAQAKEMKLTDRAADFELLWQRLGDRSIVFEREYVFHPTRKWRIDIAHLPSKVGIEIEGVTYFGANVSRHQTAKGYIKDCEKYNAAIEAGFAILRYSQVDLVKRPVQVVEQVLAVVKQRMKG